MLCWVYILTLCHRHFMPHRAINYIYWAHRRRNRGDWGGGGRQPPQSKMWGALPPPLYSWLKTPYLWIFNDIYFNYDFSLSLSVSLFFFYFINIVPLCCDFHPISVSLLFSLQIRCGNYGARHKLYAVKITATSVRIHWWLIRNLYWYSV